MQIFILTSIGKTALVLDTEAADTIELIKGKIKNKLGYPTCE